jgi:hypothetical protein
MLVPQSLGTYLLGNVMTMTISDLQRPTPTALTYSPAIDRTLRIAVLVAVTLVTCTENLTTYAVGEMLTTYSRPAQEAIRKRPWRCDQLDYPPRPQTVWRSANCTADWRFNRLSTHS